ncbi:MAG: YsnF/AvaK domain-containing protein, partial [Chitinophagaceae bacterium]|nr:YsnF/AvaK domain-containing protein [Chitinophagaceae bacterium]
MSADLERSVRKVFGTSTEVSALGVSNSSIPEGGAGFYDHEHFADDKLYNRRRQRSAGSTTIPVVEEPLNVGRQPVETGGVRIRKNVVEQPVERTVPLKEEHINIERSAADRPVTTGSFAPFEEGTIQITERGEVPVVTKEARVVEEISVGKEIEHRNETIRDTVRKTEVDIEEFDQDGRPRNRVSGNR